MTRRLANLMRTAAIVLVNAADKLDPRPPVRSVHPYEVHTATGTVNHDCTITWH